MGQEDLLLTLVQGEHGEHWAEFYGWSKLVPYCQWKGILCDPLDETTITAIELGQTKLKGTIPVEIGQLTSLRVLVLRKNSIQGSIPDAVAALPNLELLDLSDNSLSGSVPNFASHKLRELMLGYNNLSGTLAPTFGAGLSSLVELNLVGNDLTGEIPDSMGDMVNMDKLVLSANRFHGVIPTSLGRLESLKYLHLNYNLLVGTIPEAVCRESSMLSEVWLHVNSLSGTVPESMAAMQSLTDLKIHGNKLTGDIPAALCEPSIGVSDSEGGSVSSAEHVDACSGLACPANSVSTNGMWPCHPCAADMHSPFLGRQDGCLPLNQREILRSFWQETGGDSKWKNSTNWFYEGVEECDFAGVTCNDDREIVSISLPNMGLEGVLPVTVSYLPKLAKLELPDNHLKGHVPSDLRFAPLDVLDISGNEFVGVVPPLLCESNVNSDGKGGEASCDHITCPVGTYSALGRANGGSQCVPCFDDVSFMGAKSCSSTMHTGTAHAGLGPFAVTAIAGAVIVLFAALTIMTLELRKKGLLRMPKVAFLSDYTTPEFSLDKGTTSAEETFVVGGSFAGGVSMVSPKRYDDSSVGTSTDDSDGKESKQILQISNQQKVDRACWQRDWEDQKSPSPVWLDVPRIS